MIVFSTIIFIVNGFSQKISFSPVLVCGCDSSYTPLERFSLRKSDESTFKEYFNVVAVINDTGAYFLRSHLLRDDSILVNFKSFRSVADTFLKQDILEKVRIPKEEGRGDYYQCGKICEGRIIECFSNGSKKMEAKFRNGNPRGKMILYRMDGRVKAINFYNKQGKLIDRKIF